MITYPCPHTHTHTHTLAGVLSDANSKYWFFKVQCVSAPLDPLPKDNKDSATLEAWSYVKCTIAGKINHFLINL